MSKNKKIEEIKKSLIVEFNTSAKNANVEFEIAYANNIDSCFKKYYSFNCKIKKDKSYNFYENMSYKKLRENLIKTWKFSFKNVIQEEFKNQNKLIERKIKKVVKKSFKKEKEVSNRPDVKAFKNKTTNTKNIVYVIKFKDSNKNILCKIGVAESQEKFYERYETFEKALPKNFLIIEHSWFFSEAATTIEAQVKKQIENQKLLSNDLESIDKLNKLYEREITSQGLMVQFLYSIQKNFEKHDQKSIDILFKNISR